MIESKDRKRLTLISRRYAKFRPWASNAKIRRARRLEIRCLTAFVMQKWVPTLSKVSWRHTCLQNT